MAEHDLHSAACAGAANSRAWATVTPAPPASFPPADPSPPHLPPSAGAQCDTAGTKCLSCNGSRSPPTGVTDGRCALPCKQLFGIGCLKCNQSKCLNTDAKYAQGALHSLDQLGGAFADTLRAPHWHLGACLGRDVNVEGRAPAKEHIQLPQVPRPARPAAHKHASGTSCRSKVSTAWTKPRGNTSDCQRTFCTMQHSAAGRSSLRC